MKEPIEYLNSLIKRIDSGNICFKEIVKAAEKMDKNRRLYIPYIKKYTSTLQALKQKRIDEYRKYQEKNIEGEIDQYIQEYTGRDYSDIKELNSRESFLNLGIGRTVVIIESSITARALKSKIKFRTKQNSSTTVLATNGYIKSALNAFEKDNHIISQLKSINRSVLTNEDIMYINDILNRYSIDELPTAFILAYMVYRQQNYVENIVIATDQDSAGELIATEVIEYFDKRVRERIRRLKIPVETFLYLSEKGINEICLDHIIKNYSVDYIDVSLVRSRLRKKHELESLRLEILSELYQRTESDGYIYFSNSEFKVIQELAKLTEQIRPNK